METETALVNDSVNVLTMVQVAKEMAKIQSMMRLFNWVQVTRMSGTLKLLLVLLWHLQ